jgi:hypothetical protein
MKKPESDSPAAAPDPGADAEPQVLAVKRGHEVWRMDKREFLKRAVLGAVAGAGACSGQDEDGDPESDDAVPPFVVGGTTYRLIELKSYNAGLPFTGTNLAIVAFINGDFYFRSFDAEGTQRFNLHESQIPAPEQAALGDLKRLAQSLALTGSAEPAEQTRFAELHGVMTGKSTVTGRRMQGTAGEVEPGRRMQGSASPGTVTGRRMQGAEGRPESPRVRRNLGTLRVNGERYNSATIVETYTDGYTKLSHADGEAVVRTDALPEIVRMQLPIAVPNPGVVPTAVPRTTVRPAPSPPPRSSGGGGHYWRPN